MDPTELAGADLKADLRCEHKPLVGAERKRKRSHPTQVLAQKDKRLELRARIDDVNLFLLDAIERHRRLECRLHRAAARKRSTAIMDPREETLLERVCEMQPAGVPPAATSLCDQLDGGLAVGILQVLSSKPVAVHPQQQIPLRIRHQRNLISRVEAASCARPSTPAIAQGSCFRLQSGRHTSMSLASPRRPLVERP
jgi:hypothetical protein